MDSLPHPASAKRPSAAPRRGTDFRCLPELQRLERLIRKGRDHLEVRTLAEIRGDVQDYPLYALSFGSRDADAPVLLLTAGIHGVERIGTHLLLSYLSHMLARLQWDESLQQDLERMRLVFCPLINPVGMVSGHRCNGNGVDLMRNAPLDAEEPGPWLVAGHRFGRWLPWYRGQRDQPMQPEAAALCTLVQNEIRHAPFSLVLDCHSGFGMRDRIWFPYAGTTRLFEQAAEVHALMRLFEHANPYHTYIIEPQFHQYRTHGDLWDYLCRQQRQAAGGIFLPLTLEMGSWLWVRKNLRQLMSFNGLFNPVVPHRRRRTLRRHNPLLEFLLHATRSWRHWLPEGADRARHQRRAERRWSRTDET